MAKEYSLKASVQNVSYSKLGKPTTVDVTIHYRNGIVGVLPMVPVEQFHDLVDYRNIALVKGKKHTLDETVLSDIEVVPITASIVGHVVEYPDGPKKGKVTGVAINLSYGRFVTGDKMLLSLEEYSELVDDENPTLKPRRIFEDPKIPNNSKLLSI